jgi:formate-dependent nitrite reductase membrane component NrfD
MHPILAKRFEIPWMQIGKRAGIVFRPIKAFVGCWKWPIAIAMFLCSLVPVSLLYLIYAIDFRSSYRAFKHLTPPHIPLIFYELCRLGFLLPILTLALGLWFALSQSVSPAKFAWLLMGLVLLHLLWMSYGILGFYLANQHFITF